MNRRSICILFLLTAGFCSAASSRAQLSGQSPQPTALLSRAADGNSVAQKGDLLLGAPGERRYLPGCHDRSIDTGSWLLPGRILENQLETLTRLEHLAVSALIAIGLALIGFVCWKRRSLRRRIWSSRISPQELHDLMGSGHTPLIADLRTPLDMLPDPRMIPGAIRLTPEEMTRLPLSAKRNRP